MDPNPLVCPGTQPPSRSICTVRHSRSGRRLRSALLALAAYRNQPRGLGLYLLHVMPSSAYPFFRVYAAL